MMPTLYNGISGVKTHNFGIDIVGNNISNVNTVGYKSSRAEFNDIFYQALNSSYSVSNQGGIGSFGASSALQMGQGILKNSQRVLDVALEGKGFFGVQGFDGGVYYTRNGNFNIDSDYNLVDSKGNFILGMQNPGFASVGLQPAIMEMFGTNPPKNGYVFNDELDLELGAVGSMGPLKVPTNAVYLAKPTTYVNVAGSLPVSPKYASVNIDMSVDDINVQTNMIDGKQITTLSGKIEQTEDILSPKSGDRVILTVKRENEKPFLIEAILDDELNYSVDVKGEAKVVEALIQTKQEQESKKEFITDIVDANGNKAKLNITISRVLPTNGKLDYEATARIVDMQGVELATSVGLMSFNENGSLKSSTLDSIGYAGQNIKLNFGNTTGVASNGYNSVVAMDNVDIISSFDKDGALAGIFKDIDIDERGNIMINYSNGKSQAAGKLALYNFINEQGLEKMGENIYSASANSGEAYFLQKDGKVYQSAIIKSRFLEGSNVDLGTELTQMIIYQKAYEANAKSISTADAMLKRAIDMKK